MIHLYCFDLSYPLLHIPLPGTIPTKVILPYESHAATSTSISSSNLETDAPPIDGNVLSNLLHMKNSSTEQPPFPWANSDPFVYIQQIVLRSSVIPWKKNLLLTDAYRGPLHEIFKLLEIVRNHEDEIRLKKNSSELKINFNYDFVFHLQ